MTRSATKTRWLTLGVEAVLIVFSVLLALALDELRQDIADRRRVARVRGTIRDELLENRKQIAQRLPYHEKILGSTETFLQQNVEGETTGDLQLKRRPKTEDLGLGRGLGTAGSLGRTGWELALVSGALEHMDYELTTALSRLYAKQEEVETVEGRLVERLVSLYGAYFRDGNLGGDLIGFSSGLTDMVLRERELLAEYDRALAMLGR